MYKILVILPALNEEHTIGQILDQISGLKINNASIERLVVDDGSTDATADIAREKGAIVISHKKNLGVGAAFQSGVRYAVMTGADILINIDSDGQFNPLDIVKLVQPIMTGEAEFVTASRFVADDNIQMSSVKKWGNHRMADIVSRLTGQKIHDVSCGFRAYARKTFLKLTLIGDFTYTHETILTMAFMGIVIKEVAVPVRGTREFGRSRVAANLFKYGLKSLLIILRCLRDYKPMITFGIPGIFLTTIGILSLIIFFIISYISQQWFPKGLAFFSAFSILTGIIFFIISLIVDMFTRTRMQIEKNTEMLDLILRNVSKTH